MNDKYLVVDINVMHARDVANFLNKYHRDGWVLLGIISTDEYRKWPQAVFEKRVLDNVFPTVTIPPNKDNYTKEFKVGGLESKYFNGLN